LFGLTPLKAGSNSYSCEGAQWPLLAVSSRWLFDTLSGW